MEDRAADYQLASMEAISQATQQTVRARLRDIEAKEGVRIFFACESGSRAWGFPSADSDYDVRFLYAHPPDWYFSIDVERKRDVIERPIDDELDLSGWDLRKALQLFAKSNPPLLEWLQSPLIYLEATNVAERFRSLVPLYFSPRASMYHYLHMARRNFRAYLRGEEVWVKKYFYVLRPLLAVKWVISNRGPVPMEFERLVETEVLDDNVRDAIVSLVEAKRDGAELDRGPRIEPISSFIERTLANLDETLAEAPALKPPPEQLNDFFRSAVREVWR
jgi:predicted nucleotidyltransferase